MVLGKVIIAVVVISFGLLPALFIMGALKLYTERKDALYIGVAAVTFVGFAMYWYFVLFYLMPVSQAF